MKILNKLELINPIVKVENNYKAEFPRKSGTIAFTDDIEPLKTKTYQCPGIAGIDGVVVWNLELEDFYQSTPFVQIFNSSNKLISPTIEYKLSETPQVLSISFEGIDKISIGEFSAVVTIPFSVTTEIPDTVVTINTDQGIGGIKNFTGTLQYNGFEVAIKSEIPSLDGYATETYVDNRFNSVEIPDVSGFITKDVLNLANYYTKSVSDGKYALKTEIPNVSSFITKDVNNLSNYETSSVADSKYALKSDIPSITSFITADVDNLKNYTTTTDLNSLLSQKSDIGVSYTKAESDTKIQEATQHLKTKSYQSGEIPGDTWTIELESEYTSTPFFQVFNGSNEQVFPAVKFSAPSTLILTFEGRENITLGEFVAVVSVPFTTTVELDETVVTTTSDQGVGGIKNFTGTLQYKGSEVATKSEISTISSNLESTEEELKSYVDDEIAVKIASVYRFKGDSAYASLPTNAEVGDVYNLTTASGDYKVGDNVAWTGSSWDKLGGTVDLSSYLTTTTASSTYLNKTTSSVQSVTPRVDFNGGLRTKSLHSLAGSAIFDTTDSKGFNFRGIYRLFGYDISNPTVGTQFFEQVNATTNWINVTTLKENGVSLVDKYATKTDTLSKTSTESQIVSGPVVFSDLVSVSSLEVNSLDLETLNISDELTVNNVAVSESIVELQNKAGVKTEILPGKSPENGKIEWEVVINTDTTKTVLAPPNVVVCDISGTREKYILSTIEWSGNSIFITFDSGDTIPDNTYKVYVTNIQLSKKTRSISVSV